jgi:hypothetical protein
MVPGRSVRALSVGLGVYNEQPAAVLYAEANIPDAPPKYMFMPADGDAGHLAAMALYLNSNLGDAVIYVHESAMEILGQNDKMPEPAEEWPLADKAARRGVTIERGAAGLELASSDGTVHVSIHFPAWDHELAGTEDAFQLLDLTSALWEREPVS